MKAGIDELSSKKIQKRGGAGFSSQRSASLLEAGLSKAFIDYITGETENVFKPVRLICAAAATL